MTLSPGSVIVNVEPEAGIVPAATGATGLPPETCVDAVAALIWKRCAVPLSVAPLMATTCEDFERLMAMKTVRPGVVVSVLAYTTTLATLLDVDCSEVSPKTELAPSKSRNARNPASA